jgi:hypothetical protein
MKRLPDQLVRDKNKTGLPNLRHRATHSSHHTKDKQRFVVSVVAYESLPRRTSRAATAPQYRRQRGAAKPDRGAVESHGTAALYRLNRNDGEQRCNIPMKARYHAPR